MTTRKAAKAAPNYTSSIAPSPSEGNSRRSSLNSNAQLQNDHSNGDDEQANGSRVSTDSGSPQTQMGSYVSQLPVVETETISASQTVSNSSKIIGRKRRASGDSNETSKTVGATPNGVVTRSESDLSENPPQQKKRKTTEPPQDLADAAPELTDASTAPGSPEAIPEVAPSQALQNVLPAVNGEVPAKTGKRLPGRRRQPHSNINVEYKLRRQLILKMNYRTLAKNVKPLLEELAKRTLSNLENDPEFHIKCDAYERVMAELKERFEGRMNDVEAERRIKLDQQERLRVAEEHIQKEQYIVSPAPRHRQHLLTDVEPFQRTAR
jgi:hypothetical protein